MVGILKIEGRDTGGAFLGLAFCDKDGFVPVLSLAFVNTKLYEALEKVQIASRPNLIPPWVKVKEIDHYKYRSLRNGAVLRENQLGYDQSIIDRNNRWRRMQGSKGKAGLSLGQLYCLDILTLLSLNTTAHTSCFLESL